MLEAAEVLGEDATARYRPLLERLAELASSLGYHSHLSVRKNASVVRGDGSASAAAGKSATPRAVENSTAIISAPATTVEGCSGHASPVCTVTDWLKEARLGQFAETILEEGYDELWLLQALQRKNSAKELSDLEEKLQMRPGHRRKFRKRLSELRRVPQQLSSPQDTATEQTGFRPKGANATASSVGVRLQTVQRSRRTVAAMPLTADDHSDDYDGVLGGDSDDDGGGKRRFGNEFGSGCVDFTTTDSDESESLHAPPVPQLVALSQPPLDKLFRRLRTQQLASESAIEVMRDNVERKRFTAAYYQRMWEGKLGNVSTQPERVRRKAQRQSTQMTDKSESSTTEEVPEQRVAKRPKVSVTTTPADVPAVHYVWRRHSKSVAAKSAASPSSSEDEQGQEEGEQERVLVQADSQKAERLVAAVVTEIDDEDEQEEVVAEEPASQPQPQPKSEPEPEPEDTLHDEEDVPPASPMLQEAIAVTSTRAAAQQTQVEISRTRRQQAKREKHQAQLAAVTGDDGVYEPPKACPRAAGGQTPELPTGHSNYIAQSSVAVALNAQKVPVAVAPRADLSSGSSVGGSSVGQSDGDDGDEHEAMMDAQQNLGRPTTQAQPEVEPGAVEPPGARVAASFDPSAFLLSSGSSVGGSSVGQSDGDDGDEHEAMMDAQQNLGR
eukprot:COSAG01_NODE_5013_length_4542_cov_5.457799_1_plen_668_part_10